MVPRLLYSSYQYSNAYSKSIFGIAQCFLSYGLRNTSSEPQAALDKIQTPGPNAIPLNLNLRQEGQEPLYVTMYQKIPWPVNIE